MNIGDYVRTKNGIIGKIKTKNLIGYDDWIIDTLYYNDDEIIDDWTCGIKEYNVIKSSTNIIDLIEVGDYVNGLKIDEVDENGIYNYNSYDGWRVNVAPNSEYIKSIVTKEMFANAEYRVESN